VVPVYAKPVNCLAGTMYKLKKIVEGSWNFFEGLAKFVVGGSVVTAQRKRLLSRQGTHRMTSRTPFFKDFVWRRNSGEH
jgi:hypothetical protein